MLRAVFLAANIFVKHSARSTVAECLFATPKKSIANRRFNRDLRDRRCAALVRRRIFHVAEGKAVTNKADVAESSE
jgi:hypothetical protein